MANNDLTAQRVRELLEYDPDTGLFVNRVQRGPHGWSGARTGYPQTSGHIQIRVDGVKYMAHRLAWLHHYGKWPDHEIDHINGERADNRIANLRDVPRSINRQNLRRANADNGSRLLGVHFYKKSGRFGAHIGLGGELVFLGTFATAQEASEAYVSAKRRLHPGCTI